MKRSEQTCASCNYYYEGDCRIAPLPLTPNDPASCFCEDWQKETEDEICMLDDGAEDQATILADEREYKVCTYCRLFADGECFAKRDQTLIVPEPDNHRCGAGIWFGPNGVCWW